MSEADRQIHSLSSPAVDDLRAAAPSRPIWADVSFEDRMGLVEFRVGTRAHITVDGDSCRGCTTKACVTACPANLFVPTSDGGIVFNYEQCFECGTCYMVCNTEGAIHWTYPDGGNGVVFHRS
ncbi:MAG: 4Fe-4S dicluster domain-containing protein [Actinomycetes bacterium]